jgi:hypothetical protein
MQILQSRVITTLALVLSTPFIRGDERLAEKLKTINVPAVQFFESPLPEVMAELQRLAKQFDFAEPDPTKKGVNIVALNTAGELPPKCYHYF